MSFIIILLHSHMKLNCCCQLCFSYTTVFSIISSYFINNWRKNRSLENIIFMMFLMLFMLSLANTIIKFIKMRNIFMWWQLFFLINKNWKNFNSRNKLINMTDLLNMIIFLENFFIIMQNNLNNFWHLNQFDNTSFFSWKELLTILSML